MKQNLKKWRFTGNPVCGLRDNSWQFLRRLAGIHELKNIRWLVGGDFNEILYESEKYGGTVRSESQMSFFRSITRLWSFRVEV